VTFLPSARAVKGRSSRLDRRVDERCICSRE
jgi:hypothetical protein